MVARINEISNETKPRRKRELAPYVLPAAGDVMINVKQVAAAIGCGISTVWMRVRSDPTFVKPVKLWPGCTRFSAAALREWLAKSAMESVASDQPTEARQKAARISVEKRRAAHAAANDQLSDKPQEPADGHSATLAAAA